MISQFRFPYIFNILLLPIEGSEVLCLFRKASELILWSQVYELSHPSITTEPRFSVKVVHVIFYVIVYRGYSGTQSVKYDGLLLVFNTVCSCFVIKPLEINSNFFRVLSLSAMQSFVFFVSLSNREL